MLVPMNAPKDHSCDTEILETLSRRVMVGDGAMGTQLQAADLTLDDSPTGADAVETKYVRLQFG